ncbi:MAG: hypothetical protein AAB320_06215 [Elusimicrobiota bacterium]|mgnify:CR=1 FL=1
MMRRLAFAMMVFGLAACGKDESPSAGAPKLSAPERAFPAAGQPSAQADVAAEAEVKASSGPIELTLRVYRSNLKYRKDSLWFQIQLKNIGKNKIRIDEDDFRVPGEVAMGGGRLLEVVDAKGNPAKQYTIFSAAPDQLTPDSPIWPQPSKDSKDPEGDKKRIADAIWAEGDRLRQRDRIMEAGRGRPDSWTYRKLTEFDEKHPAPPEPPSQDTSILLAPGVVLVTPPWVDRSYLPDQPPGKIGEFAQLRGYYFGPGKYRIRAVYDHRPSGWTVEYNKKHHLNPDEDEVRVETPYIAIEVVP